MATTKPERDLHVQEMRADLERLIEAIDRRVPRLERIGEAQIAREAADLRQRAVGLIKRIDDESNG